MSVDKLNKDEGVINVKSKSRFLISSRTKDKNI